MKGMMNKAKKALKEKADVLIEANAGKLQALADNAGIDVDVEAVAKKAVDKADKAASKAAEKYGNELLKKAESKASKLTGQEMTLESVMADPRAALKAAAEIEKIKSLENSLKGATGLEISASSLVDDPLAELKAELTA